MYKHSIQHISSQPFIVLRCTVTISVKQLVKLLDIPTVEITISGIMHEINDEFLEFIAAHGVFFSVFTTEAK